MRILIVKLSAIGDTALALPLLWKLRRELPRARVGWLVGERAAPLLEPFGDIDRLHVWRREDESFRGCLRLAREIRAARYDVSLDAQCLTKSAIVPFLARIPRRVGYGRYPFGGRELSTWFNNELVPPPGGGAPGRSRREPVASLREGGFKSPAASRRDATRGRRPRGGPMSPARASPHVTDQALSLARAVGADVEALPPFDMRVDPEAAARVRRWWKGQSLGERVIVFGIGAGWPTKVLPLATVAALAREARESGYRCVLLWGPSEESGLDSTASVFGEDACLAPRTDVKEMVALLSLAGRYAGPDTGALHIAALLGKPTFSWFGASDPERCAPGRGACATKPTDDSNGEALAQRRAGPQRSALDARHVFVTKGLDCQPCWRRKCPAPLCLTELRPSEILPAFVNWL